jgi:hypothetical protein
VNIFLSADHVGLGYILWYQHVRDLYFWNATFRVPSNKFTARGVL